MQKLVLPKSNSTVNKCGLRDFQYNSSLYAAAANCQHVEKSETP